MNNLRVVEATFAPKSYVTLPIAARAWIGRRMNFIASFKIDDGIYKGQWAMWPAEKSARGAWWFERAGQLGGWVPEEDLQAIVVIDPGYDENWNRIDDPKDTKEEAK